MLIVSVQELTTVYSVVLYLMNRGPMSRTVGCAASLALFQSQSSNAVITITAIRLRYEYDDYDPTIRRIARAPPSNSTQAKK